VLVDLAGIREEGIVRAHVRDGPALEQDGPLRPDLVVRDHLSPERDERRSISLEFSHAPVFFPILTPTNPRCP
jgi:hypothetical protein